MNGEHSRLIKRDKRMVYEILLGIVPVSNWINCTSMLINSAPQKEPGTSLKVFVLWINLFRFPSLMRCITKTESLNGFVVILQANKAIVSRRRWIANTTDNSESLKSNGIQLIFLRTRTPGASASRTSRHSAEDQIAVVSTAEIIFFRQRTAITAAVSLRDSIADDCHRGHYQPRLNLSLSITLLVVMSRLIKIRKLNYPMASWLMLPQVSMISFRVELRRESAICNYN